MSDDTLSDNTTDTAGAAEIRHCPLCGARVAPLFAFMSAGAEAAVVECPTHGEMEAEYALDPTRARLADERRAIRATERAGSKMVYALAAGIILGGVLATFHPTISSITAATVASAGIAYDIYQRYTAHRAVEQ